MFASRDEYTVSMRLPVLQRVPVMSLNQNSEEYGVVVYAGRWFGGGASVRYAQVNNAIYQSTNAEKLPHNRYRLPIV